MARTHGHGNPNWSREETILALDLYFDMEGKVASGRDPRVRELSELLRRFPYHADASKRESFRNPDGVAFKLQNLRQVATGKGLGNVSETDRMVWAQFGSSAQKTKSIADLIRSTLAESEVKTPTTADVEFVEGRLVTELHSRRERDSKIRDRLLCARRASDKLYCEMCGKGPHAKNIALREAQFEVHHIIPLAIGMRETRLSDMALLCANCHRILHRAIALEKRWLTIAEGKEVCGL